ncbi:receptor-like protein EIX2 [Lycium ferocissimum]|uniref:receptor-like protein EIX2 n=1 Tax=Lycium ferocissimum TaxID=112874 RepID=UPI0028152808|nr:receptor-like protein EIX2 [Lycium ferocissimum]
MEAVFIGLAIGTSSEGDTRRTLCIESERQTLLKFKQGSSILESNITPSLLELQHLKYLDLSYNHFGRSRIPDFISSFPRQEYLNLESTDFVGDHIPHNLGKLTHLQILDLSLNYGLVAKSLEWLPRLALLRDLDLNMWFFNLSTRFIAIDLSSNHLRGPIPEAFGYMKHLEVIKLAANTLEGVLPKAFGNLSHLKTLGLSSNKFNQPLPELLLHLSGKAETSLEELSLSGNHLSGSLPDITRFSSLKSLNLQENQLNGSFLESYGQTSKIEVLNLSGNQITGSLPNLTTFSALKELHSTSLRFRVLGAALPRFRGEFKSKSSIRRKRKAQRYSTHKGSSPIWQY